TRRNSTWLHAARPSRAVCRWRAATGRSSEQLPSASSCSEGTVSPIFPEHLAFAVHLDDGAEAVGSDEEVAAGQAGDHGDLLHVQLQEHLAFGIVFGDLVAAVLGHDDLAGGRDVEPGVAAAGVEGLELFAVAIEAEALAVLAHENDVAIASLVGAGERAHLVDELLQVGVLEPQIHVLAVAVNFGELDVAGNEDVAVVQDLNVHGAAIERFGPKDVALEVPASDPVAAVFGDARPVGGQPPRIAGVSGPPERPANFAVAAQLDDLAGVVLGDDGEAEPFVVRPGELDQIDLGGVGLPPGGPVRA